jgi:hypothetical protein
MASNSFLRVIGTDDIVVPYHQPAQIYVAQEIIEELQSSHRHDGFTSAYNITLYTRYAGCTLLHPQLQLEYSQRQGIVRCAKGRAMLQHRHSPARIRTMSRAALPWGYATMRGDLIGDEYSIAGTSTVFFIKQRKGFIKYALMHEYNVHPSYIFGEEKTYLAASWLQEKLMF